MHTRLTGYLYGYMYVESDHGPVSSSEDQGPADADAAAAVQGAVSKNLQRL